MAEETPRQRAKREKKPYLKVIVDTRWSGPEGGWCWEGEGPVDNEIVNAGHDLLGMLAGNPSKAGARIAELEARLADAEGEGCTLHGDAPHGKEAEELRKGIELLMGKWASVHRRELQALLDRVAARDSLAHLRANEELAAARAKVAELEALFQQTHGCHVSWVLAAKDRERERDEAREQVAHFERVFAAKGRSAELEKYAADVEADLVFNGKLMGLLAAGRGLVDEYDKTVAETEERRVQSAMELVMDEVRKIDRTGGV